MVLKLQNTYYKLYAITKFKSINPQINTTNR